MAYPTKSPAKRRPARQKAPKTARPKKKGASTGLKKIQDKLEKEYEFRVKPGNARTYHMKEKFIPGEKIKHSKFGEGVVEREVSDTKIEVAFEEGVKVLIHDVPPLVSI